MTRLINLSEHLNKITIYRTELRRLNILSIDIEQIILYLYPFGGRHEWTEHINIVVTVVHVVYGIHVELKWVGTKSADSGGSRHEINGTRVRWLSVDTRIRGKNNNSTELRPHVRIEYYTISSYGHSVL